MKFLNWLMSRTGTPVDVDDAFGPQCTDLVNDYLRQVWHQGPLGGNAIDFQRGHIPSWTWTRNTPTNRPPTGAIVVWNGPNALIGTSIYGHTAVALLSDLQRILTLDQNWGADRAPRQVYHPYAAVAGWFAPPLTVLDYSF